MESFEQIQETNSNIFYCLWSIRSQKNHQYLSHHLLSVNFRGTVSCPLVWRSFRSMSTCVQVGMVIWINIRVLMTYFGKCCFVNFWVTNWKSQKFVFCHEGCSSQYLPTNQQFGERNKCQCHSNLLSKCLLWGPMSKLSKSQESVFINMQEDMSVEYISGSQGSTFEHLTLRPM